MTIDHSFIPDAARARALDSRMRSELANSIEHIAAQIHLATNDARIRTSAELFQPALSLLRTDQRVSPLLFACYYQMVFSLLNDSPLNDSLLNEGNRFDESAFELVQVATPMDRLSFKDLSKSGVGSDRLVSIYRAALDTDDKAPFSFLPPSPEQSRMTRESVVRALALMRQTAPELAGEFEQLVGEILLAAAPDNPGAARFDGASSYQLWGALALSVDDEKSDLEMMETLAHEAGHSFLFGLTVHEPLVFNDDDELFRSPLRPDPRPMDGIYHATYVSARMHYAMLRARNSGLLDKAQMQESENYLRASARAFADGYAVVATGDLSQTGRMVMDSACRFMEENGVRS